MSNALAIATVTTALAQIARTAVQSIVNGADVVTVKPDPNTTPAHRVHLFLYQVTFNASLRNNDLPMRSADGKVISRPVAALDLHYLLSFFGNEAELESQRMLCAVVRDLNTQSILTRPMIQNAINSQSFLSGSNLTDAIELVKITPSNMSLEEMSKLWSVFFQTPYSLSVAYQASVVLIESDIMADAALPVLKRGDSDKGIDTLLGPFPSLQSAWFGMPQDQILRSRPISMPAARLGSLVILAGKNLGGEDMYLRFTHSKFGLTQEFKISFSNVSPNELKIVLPQPGTGTSQTDWYSGIYTVTAVEKRSGNSQERTSNGLPIVLSPIISAIEPGMTITRDSNGNAAVTITCQPRVHSEQKAVLLLAGRETVGVIDSTNPDKVNFLIVNAAAVDNEVIRIRIDGIESQPFTRVDTPPPIRFEFDPGQRVTIL